MKKLLEAIKSVPRNTRKPTTLRWKDESGKIVDERYRLIRGAVAWPREGLPGVVLMAGQEFGSDKVIIFEDIGVVNLSEAIDAFEKLWIYLPDCYYFHDILENAGFINHLRRNERLRGKLPFSPAVNPEGIDFGNNLIRALFGADMLAVPPDAILAKQLSEARQDTEELSGIAALRFLLTGIDARSWPFEIHDLDFSRLCA